MILDGNQVLSEGGFLLANAPTGIGKTAAALSIALTAARAREGPTHILFMTGRQSQHRIVVDTVRRINEGLSGEDKVSLVDMIGQKGMCINALADGYGANFSRLCGELRSKRKCEPYLAESPALRSKVLQDPLHVEELVSLARNHRAGGVPQPTCPWKVARETAASAHVFVCDYNHLFSEVVREASLGAMGMKMSDMILIIDEAHNLPDRIRMGLRSRLTPDLVRDAVYELEETREGIQAKAKGDDAFFEQATVRHVTACEAALKRYRNRLATWIRETKEAHRDPNDIGAEVELRVEAGLLLGMLLQELESDVSGVKVTFSDLVKELFAAQVDVAEDDEEDTATDRLATVLSILDRFSQAPEMCAVLNARADHARVTTHLLDPAIVSRTVFEEVLGAVLMSGTLTPPSMYADSLGIPPGRAVTTAAYPSPFMADRRPVMIAKGVTSRYQRRGPENTARIRRHLHALLQHTPGHVAVFCPSYAMLEEIVGEADWPGRSVLIETQGWSKKRVESVLQQLRDARMRGTRVLLAGVFGGRLSEGVDFSGNILDAVACVGIPAAPKSVPNDALRDYVKSKHGENKAWQYVVMQPGVNRILQGMGRAIRKAEDRAFILLLDDRLLTHNYQRCLPSTFDPFTSDDPARTASMVRRFFARHPEPARGEGDAPSPPSTSSDSRSVRSSALPERTETERRRELEITHPSAYVRWTDDEERILRDGFHAGRTVKELAAELRRQPGGIRARLRKLGLSRQKE